MTKPASHVVHVALLAGLLSGLSAATALAAGSHGSGHGNAMPFGQPDDPGKAERSIEVVLLDTEFNLPHLHVRDGETVRFRIRNEGELVHEFNIGTPHMHREHQAEMMEMVEQGMIDATSVHDGMDHHAMAGGKDGAMAHDDPNSILLEPGESAELTWTFRKADHLEYACNLPGHYQLGMVGPIEIDG